MVEVASDGMSWDVIEILPPYDGIMSCILLSMTRVFKEKVNVNDIRYIHRGKMPFSRLSKD